MDTRIKHGEIDFGSRGFFIDTVNGGPAPAFPVVDYGNSPDHSSPTVQGITVNVAAPVDGQTFGQSLTVDVVGGTITPDQAPAPVNVATPSLGVSIPAPSTVPMGGQDTSGGQQVTDAANAATAAEAGAIAVDIATASN